MTLSEYRMMISDLALQADIRWDNEKKAFDAFRKDISQDDEAAKAILKEKEENLKKLEIYKERTRKLKQTMHDMLDNNQPATNAQYTALMEQTADSFQAILEVYQVYASFGYKEYMKLREVAAIASRVDVARGVTLKGAMAETQKKVVKLTSDPNYMGAASNQRHMMKVTRQDGTKVEGFFTTEHGLFEFDPHGVADSLLKDAKRAHAEDTTLAAFVDKVLASLYKSSSILLCTKTKEAQDRDRQIIERGRLAAEEEGKEYKEPELLEGYHTSIMKGMKLIDESNGLSLKQIKENSNIMNLLKKIRSTVTEDEVKKMNSEYIQYGDRSLQGIAGEVGSAKAGRNYALSKMAALLGASDLIARAEPLTAEYGGQHYHGIFMEKAEGESFRYVQSEMMISGFAKMTTDSFGPEALKQLAKIQIIDYLCQNVDRNAANFLLKFDKDGKVTGVTGIDNDYGFGTFRLKEDQKIHYGVTLDNITVIPEETAEIINKLDHSVLRGVLSDTGLTEREISAAILRFDNLKNRINDKNRNNPADEPVNGRIKILSSDDWKKQRLEKLGAEQIEDSEGKKIQNNSLFEMVMHIEKTMRPWKNMEDKDKDYREFLEKERSKHEKEGEIKLPFTDADNLTLVSSEALKEYSDTLKNHLEKFGDLERLHPIKQKPYLTMKKALKQLMKEVPAEDMSMDDCLEFEKKLASLEEKTNQFITGETMRIRGEEVKNARREEAENARREEAENARREEDENTHRKETESTRRKEEENARRREAENTRLKEAKSLADYVKSYRESFRTAYNEKMEAEMEEYYHYYDQHRKVDEIAHAIVKGCMRIKEDTDRTVIQSVENTIRESEAFTRLLIAEVGEDRQSGVDFYGKLAMERPEQVFEAYLKELKLVEEKKKAAEEAQKKQVEEEKKAAEEAQKKQDEENKKSSEEVQKKQAKEEDRIREEIQAEGWVIL